MSPDEQTTPTYTLVDATDANFAVEMPTLPVSGLTSGRESCEVYSLILSLWYGVAALCQSALLYWAWMRQAHPFPHLWLAVVVWGLLVVFQCGPSSINTVEIVNSSPSLIFMAACAVVMFTLIAPYTPDEVSRRHLLKVGIALVAISGLFDIVLFCLSLSPTLGETKIGITLYSVYFVYFFLGALGFLYAAKCQNEFLLESGHRRLRNHICRCLTASATLLTIRSSIMLYGVFSRPFDLSVVDFRSQTSASNALAYFYYFLLELCVIILLSTTLYLSSIAARILSSIPETESLLGSPVSSSKRHSYLLREDAYASLFSNFPQVKKSELTLGRAVGQGAFATVYKARWHGTIVAVKLFHVPIEFATPQIMKDVAEEMAFLRDARHPNILQYLGTTPPPWLSIVTEFMDMGSLEDALGREEYAVELSRCTLKVAICRQIASGMCYLHESGVLHRDLCPTNILLGSGWVTKIGDLGLARVKEASTPMTRMTLGTPSYIAPEVIDSHAYNTKSDVYSFAVIVWRTVARVEPWELTSMSLFSLFSKIKGGERPNVEDFSNEALMEFLASCWEGNPEARPSFQKIVKWLPDLCLSKEEGCKECKEVRIQSKGGEGDKLNTSLGL